MKKYIVLIAVCALVGSVAFGAGKETFGTKEEGKTGLPSLVSKLNTNFGILMDVTTASVASSTSTNALNITTGGIYQIFPNAAAGGTVNTNTLPNAAYKGQTVLIVVDPLATNSVAIAKSGNFAGPAILLAPGEATIIVATKAGGTNAWSGIVQ